MRHAAVAVAVIVIGLPLAILLLLGQVGRAHCCARPPSEPGRAAFTASGSSKPYGSRASEAPGSCLGGA